VTGSIDTAKTIASIVIVSYFERLDFVLVEIADRRKLGRRARKCHWLGKRGRSGFSSFSCFKCDRAVGEGRLQEKIGSKSKRGQEPKKAAEPGQDKLCSDWQQTHLVHSGL
jgi:hypothetical protein